MQKKFMIFGILLFWFTYAIMPVGNGINTCIFNENPRESHSLGRFVYHSDSTDIHCLLG